MPAFVPHEIFHQTFLLTACRTVFWEEEKTLILSDLHLGKSGHFRKSGIAIPQTVFKEDMQRLLAEIQFFKPRQLIVVGDLFHSGMNREHELFLKWRADVRHTEFHLVKGNHDILKTGWYDEAGIRLHKKHFSLGKFTFTHDINECETGDDRYCFSGHIHPGVQLRGIAKQGVALPCFYFAKDYAVLPAFGKFTGIYPLKPAKSDSVYVLLKDSVMKLQ